MPSVAGRIPRLDLATRDARFPGVGSDPLEDLAAVPKHAIPGALDRTIAGGTVAAIRNCTGAAGR